MSEPSKHDDDPASIPRIEASWLRQYGLALEFLGLLGILGYVGYRIDLKYASQPWGIMGGFMLAMTAGIYRMMQEAKRLDKKNR